MTSGGWYRSTRPAVKLGKAAARRGKAFFLGRRAAQETSAGVFRRGEIEGGSKVGPAGFGKVSGGIERGLIAHCIGGVELPLRDDLRGAALEGLGLAGSDGHATFNGILDGLAIVTSRPDGARYIPDEAMATVSAAMRALVSCRHGGPPSSQ